MSYIPVKKSGETSPDEADRNGMNYPEKYQECF